MKGNVFGWNIGDAVKNGIIGKTADAGSIPAWVVVCYFLWQITDKLGEQTRLLARIARKLALDGD